jgi:hypothetical protein
VNTECGNDADAETDCDSQNRAMVGGRQLPLAAAAECGFQSSVFDPVNNEEPAVLSAADERVRVDKTNESETDHGYFSSVTSLVSNAHFASVQECQHPPTVDKSSPAAVGLCLEVDEDEENTTLDVTEFEWQETQVVLDGNSKVCAARVQNDAEDNIREGVVSELWASASSVQITPTSQDKWQAAADSCLSVTGNNHDGRDDLLSTKIECEVHSDETEDDWSLDTLRKADVETTEIKCDFIDDNAELLLDEESDETNQSARSLSPAQQSQVFDDNPASHIHGRSAITMEQEVVEPDGVGHCVDGVTDEGRNGIGTVEVFERSFALLSLESIDASSMPVEQEDFELRVDRSNDDGKSTVETVKVSAELYLRTSPPCVRQQPDVCDEFSNIEPTVTVKQEVIAQPVNDVVVETNSAAGKVEVRKGKGRKKEINNTVLMDQELDASQLSPTAGNLSRRQNLDESFEMPYDYAESDAIAGNQKRQDHDTATKPEKEHSSTFHDCAEFDSILDDFSSQGERLAASDACTVDSPATEHVERGNMQTAVGESDERQQAPSGMDHTAATPSRRRKKLSSPKVRLKSPLQAVSINYDSDASAEHDGAVPFQKNDLEVLSPNNGRRVKRNQGCQNLSTGDASAEHENGATAEIAIAATTKKARRSARSNSLRQLQTSVETTNLVQDATGNIEDDVPITTRRTLSQSPFSGAPGDTFIDCSDDRRQYRASDSSMDAGNRTAGDDASTRIRRTKNSGRVKCPADEKMSTARRKSRTANSDGAVLTADSTAAITATSVDGRRLAEVPPICLQDKQLRLRVANGGSDEHVATVPASGRRRVVRRARDRRDQPSDDKTATQRRDGGVSTTDILCDFERVKMDILGSSIYSGQQRRLQNHAEYYSSSSAGFAPVSRSKKIKIPAGNTERCVAVVGQPVSLTTGDDNNRGIKRSSSIEVAAFFGRIRSGSGRDNQSWKAGGSLPRNAHITDQSHEDMDAASGYKPERAAGHRRRLRSAAGTNEHTDGRVANVERRRFDVSSEQNGNCGSDCTSSRMSDDSGTSGTLDVPRPLRHRTLSPRPRYVGLLSLCFLWPSYNRKRPSQVVRVATV